MKAKRSSRPSEKKEGSESTSPSIIPDYLLKQVQDYHKKQGASPKVLKRDEQNRQKSEQLRKQRERKYKKN